MERLGSNGGRPAGTTEAHAVILAAGRGLRMRAFTTERPKCLLPIGDGTLLDHQLETLSALGISKISIVAGYHAEQVHKAVDGRANIIFNRDWADTNRLYSLSLCCDASRCETLLILNCDVLADPRIVGRVLSVPGNAFAYDSKSGAEDEHMKVELEGDQLRSMCKELPDERVHGENVGVLRFEGPAVSLLLGEAALLLANGGRKQWLAAAVERVARRVPVRGVDVAGLPWCEIDFPEDLRVARETIWPALSASSCRTILSTVSQRKAHPDRAA